MICNDIKDQMFWLNSKCGNFLSIKKKKKKRSGNFLVKSVYSSLSNERLDAFL